MRFSQTIKTVPKPLLAFFIILPFILLISTASAKTLPDNEIEIKTKTEQAKQNLVSINDNIGYEHLVDQLKKVVQRDGTSSINHFFVAKYPEGDNSTYMVWREGRHMWILSIDGGDDPDYWTSVEFPSSGEYLSFDKDVVTSKEQIGTSTYLVDQAWVNEKVFETVIDGDLIVIEK